MSAMVRVYLQGLHILVIDDVGSRLALEVGVGGGQVGHRSRRIG